MDPMEDDGSLNNDLFHVSSLFEKVFYDENEYSYTFYFLNRNYTKTAQQRLPKNKSLNTKKIFSFFINI